MSRFSRFLSGTAMRRLWRLPALLVGFAIVCNAGSAPAGFSVHVTSATVLPGQGGHLDVWLKVLGSDQDHLAGYMVELVLSGPTDGVRFTAFAEADDAVFEGQTPAITNGASLPGMVAAANDFLWSGDQLILDGAGLFRVFFETDLGSEGVYTVEFTSNSGKTAFSDGSGNLLTATEFGSGTITVTPEPSAAVGGLGLMTMLVGYVSLRRGKRTRGEARKAAV